MNTWVGGREDMDHPGRVSAECCHRASTAAYPDCPNLASQPYGRRPRIAGTRSCPLPQRPLADAWQNGMVRFRHGGCTD